MNIYRVTNIDSCETFEGTTEQVMDKFYITKDALYWHAKTKSQYGGFVFEKIGTDGTANKKKYSTRKTKTNGSLDDDVRKANNCGLSYGQWRLLQNRG